MDRGYTEGDIDEQVDRVKGLDRVSLLSRQQQPKDDTPGGGGTSLWVRRGCAPVLGSFWPENSGIGVSFYWKISVIGVYFHSEFSGIGGYSKFCNGC